MRCLNVHADNEVIIMHLIDNGKDIIKMYLSVILYQP